MFVNTNIHTIPLRVIIQNEDEFLDTRQNRESKEIFKLNAGNTKISTSMASIGELQEKYKELLKIYDHIIHMTIAPNLSGMHQTASMVANETDFFGKVTIIDQFITANPIVYMAKKFQLMIEKGVDDVSEFQKFANEVSPKVFLGLIPGDIAKLNKGGRTKAIKLGISTTLSGLLEKAVAEIKNNNPDGGNKVLLVYSPAIGEKTLKHSKQFLEDNKVDYELQLMPAIYSMHAGNDTVAILSIPKELL
ncbi:hypothetical protein FQR65_LT17089 [Abscondita terminalis]|nr:hypothetical protein FQR65_LT17089 [Abscondita terminalis]